MEKQTPVLSRRLSGIDAAFLYLERKEIPLNIACVATFDGPIPFREFVANIDSKLDLIPRYRQIAAPPSLNIGYPTWEYDPEFDIRRHIFPVRLEAPGGEAELEALASRLLSQRLDRGKPLWEIHVIDGLAGGRGALIARIHHALADGVAGAALLRIMLDPTPEGSHAILRQSRRPKGARGQTALVERGVAEQIGNAIQSALENAVAAEAGLLHLASSLLSDQGKTALQKLAPLLPEWLQPPERFPFNKPCTGDRKFCWAEADFHHVDAIRAALGGKVNDCILSVVMRALARYIRLHGESVEGRFLRVVCPVNLRGDEQGESLGNRITFLPVVLPLDVDDPVEMLHAVSRRMEVMKSVHAAEVIAIVASCLGAAPAPVQELFWKGLPMIPLPLPLLNLICTNVPGSPVALYSVGRRMLACYPHVPTGYELGVGIAVQSYDGKLCFGLTADAHVVPDVGRMRDLIRECFDELAEAAGVKAPRRSAAPRRARSSRAAAVSEKAKFARRRHAKAVPPAEAGAAVETPSAQMAAKAKSPAPRRPAKAAAAVETPPAEMAAKAKSPAPRRPAKAAAAVETPSAQMAAKAKSPAPRRPAKAAAAVETPPAEMAAKAKSPAPRRPAKAGAAVETPSAQMAAKAKSATPTPPAEAAAAIETPPAPSGAPVDPRIAAQEALELLVPPPAPGEQPDSAEEEAGWEEPVLV